MQSFKLKAITKKQTPFWLPEGAYIQFYSSENLAPSGEIITCSLAVPIYEQKILLINHNKRSWDIPGGHREKGETPYQTLQREVYEEAYLKFENAIPFAYAKIHNESHTNPNDGYPYPTSYIQFYLLEGIQEKNFKAEYETCQRKWFDTTEANQVSWIQRHQELYKLALDLS